MGRWRIIFGLGMVAALVTLQPLALSARIGSFADLQRRLSGNYTGPARPADTRRPDGPEGCIYPPLVPTARLVLITADRGQAVSSATIASPDVEVTSAIVTVEPGQEPLYIIAASSQPMIWRVQGAVARVRHMVLASQGAQHGLYQRSPPLVGATGLSRDQVTILSYVDCLRTLGYSSLSPTEQSAGIIHSRVGRAPDIALAAELVSHVSVPSGTMAVTKPYAGQGGLDALPLMLFWATGMKAPSFLFRSDLARDLRLEYPDGVAQIDPGSVVASAPVRSYDILPGHAGLKQLVDRGAVQETRNGEFRILRKIHMPGRTVFGTFLLPKGVPSPDGDTSGVCLVSEETGRPVPDGYQRNPRC